MKFQHHFLIITAAFFSFVQLTSAGSFVTNGPLNATRCLHTTTLLHNGKLLVAGGPLSSVFVNGIPSTSTIVNISVPVPVATTLANARILNNGAFQFSFTNTPGALFSVLTTTNPAQPLTNWTLLGGVAEVSPGQFQFTDTQSANGSQRFYRLRAP